MKNLTQQIILGSAPAPGAVRRASRRTFAMDASKLKKWFVAVVRLADEASTKTREGARAPQMKLKFCEHF
jgi:hypothetical protein